MNAMILAAGRGERLRPYTNSCPKPLLEVKGKAIIEYHLQALADAGVTSVVINVSWLAAMVQDRLGDGSEYGLEIVYSLEHEALETAGGIVQALPHLQDRFIVVNGDVFCDYPFQQLQRIKTDAHLVLVANPAHNPAGDFALNNGMIGNETDNRFTFAGIAVYQKRFFTDVPRGKRALAPLLRSAADENRVSGELYKGHWTDVGTLERWQSIAKY